MRLSVNGIVGVHAAAVAAIGSPGAPPVDAQKAAAAKLAMSVLTVVTLLALLVVVVLVLILRRARWNILGLGKRRGRRKKRGQVDAWKESERRLERDDDTVDLDPGELGRE